MEGRGVLQDFIPDVQQLNLAQVPIEGWIIDPYENGLLDGPANTMCFPTHFPKTVHIDAVAQRVTMFMYEGGGPKIFLKPVH